MTLRELVEKGRRLLLCVIHLPPLPGSPRWSGSVEELVDFAVRNARRVEEGGADGIILENFHDNPFPQDDVPDETLVAMSVIVREVSRSVSVPVGVNLLRSACREAAIVAALCGASFIRCNAYCETISCPEGIIQPQAREVQMVFKNLGKRVEVLADVFVKHASPLHSMSIRDVVENCVERCLADFIVVTGRKTGEAPEPELFQEVLKYSRAPVLVGSGTCPENVRLYRGCAGVIVGTYIKDERGEVDPRKVRNMRSALDQI